MDLVTCAALVFPAIDISAKTLTNYQGAFRRYIQPQLGSRGISDIQLDDLHRILDPLPPQTRYQTLMVLRTLFREAQGRGWVLSNPASQIRPPRVAPDPRTFLKLETVLQAEFGPASDSIRFLALHGLRWGEFAALKTEDIHDARVHVVRSIHGKTKTPAGVRSVPYLGYWPEHLLSRSTVFRALRPHGVNIHSLRKTYAYALKSAGIHVTTAAKLMGHADPAVTLRIYTQVLDSEVDDAGETLRLKFII